MVVPKAPEGFEQVWKTNGIEIQYKFEYKACKYLPNSAVSGKLIRFSYHTSDVSLVGLYESSASNPALGDEISELDNNNLLVIRPNHNDITGILYQGNKLEYQPIVVNLSPPLFDSLNRPIAPMNELLIRHIFMNNIPNEPSGLDGQLEYNGRIDCW